MATYVVGTGSDDCIRRLTPAAWDLTSGSGAAGALNVTTYQYGGGMRFTNILIPRGARIDEAHLTFVASVPRDGVVVRTRISAEDVDNAVTFADDADAFDTRWANRTTARVDWDDIDDWNTAVHYNSPDIKAVIQEIVDRVGWASGQAIVIFWEDFEDRSDHVDSCMRSYESYEGGALVAPELVVTYTEIPRGQAGINPALLELLGY